MFAAVIPSFVRPDRQVFVACWGGLVALQLVGAACLRAGAVPDASRKPPRQTMALLAFRVTFTAGAIPCLMLLLFVAMEVAGPGAITESLEGLFIPLAIVGVPIAASALLCAIVLQVIGQFGAIAVATQAVSVLSTVWPYLFYWFVD